MAEMTEVRGAAWDVYQEAWSDMPEAKRRELLEKALAEGCRFASPAGEGEGIEALVTHIGEFQAQYPGAYFKTFKFLFHHDQALAHWTMFGKDGAEFLQGHSAVRFNESGELVSLAGFWEL
ncbi:MAG: nuclear transport factor 2 family protein [Edaphobacter sp.]|uniref:nuclear transport factor 2 family protein n=1 Tax=Edaphobacter sp. TaxID=1934404 RepID=UPI0023A75B73|nr:nuclear transport factor 2 family protein [Edaphobacter sp.]MDE1178799.1 nuclear transport factor 2 family protein [Edaphobacter sp.]